MQQLHYEVSGKDKKRVEFTIILLFLVYLQFCFCNFIWKALEKILFIQKKEMFSPSLAPGSQEKRVHLLCLVFKMPIWK